MDTDPFTLGKCRAFNYTGNEESKFREPRLILGPQWYFPLVELIIVNTVSILVMIFGNHARFAATIGIGITILVSQNLCFLYFTFQNPGFAPRDPSVHSVNHREKAKVIR